MKLAQLLDAIGKHFSDNIDVNFASVNITCERKTFKSAIL